MEEWRDIPNYPNYQVSNLGNVRSITHYDALGRLRHGITKKLKKHPKGYLSVVLRHSDLKLVHRLVAMAFLGDLSKSLDVNHKDGNKQNNVVGNLEWVTKSENQKHRYDVLGKITENQTKAIRGLAQKRKEEARKNILQTWINSDMTLKELSMLTGASKSTLSRIRNGK